jgi:hypothetical protein
MPKSRKKEKPSRLIHWRPFAAMEDIVSGNLVDSRANDQSQESLRTPARGGSMSIEEFGSCIQACNECADACDQCAVACLHEDQVKMMIRCIELDIDCAAICRLAAAFMARGSDSAIQLCAVCAGICDQCSVECQKHEAAHCRECAVACKRCAEECRRMANPPDRGRAAAGG